MAPAMTGMVFDIRELTVHDGPGIRTTIFLKGCLLRCAWCHNPEGLSPVPQLMHGASGERLVGRSYTSKELAQVLNGLSPLLRDIGGVTFSGGEPLMQAAFVADTISRLNNLHITLGTSGFASEQDFRLVTDQCDLILFDLKLMDSEAHLYWTGQDNGRILQNLHVLSEMETPFIIRIPLVPGVTDTDENLGAIAAHLRLLPRIPRVELLPYNRAAGAKYAACGLEWPPRYREDQPVNAHLELFRNLDVEASIL
jgi:pyruvate formate lyase activating enzyme